jgi:hypothetical protein
MKWIRKIRSQELQVEERHEGSSNSASPLTYLSYDQAIVDLMDPQPFDVLLGRGATLQRHPGNLYFRSLIDARREMYDCAGRGTKSEIASKIIQLVKDSFGRFLKQERNGVWTEVEDDVARLKASTAFRTWRSTSSKAGRSAKITSDPLQQRFMTP